jgi:hypothetical protein
MESYVCKEVSRSALSGDPIAAYSRIISSHCVRLWRRVLLLRKSRAYIQKRLVNAVKLCRLQQGQGLRI